MAIKLYIYQNYSTGCQFTVWTRLRRSAKLIEMDWMSILYWLSFGNTLFSDKSIGSSPVVAFILKYFTSLSIDRSTNGRKKNLDNSLN